MLKHKLFTKFLGIMSLSLLFYLYPHNSCANNIISIKIHAHTPKIIHAEVADSQPELEKGLMFRTNLPENSGMLFVFPKAQIIKMWMKNTLIPLDMVFINDEKIIVHIANNAKPESLEVISSEIAAKYVLELNAGYANSNGLKTGDKVDINL